VKYTAFIYITGIQSGDKPNTCSWSSCITNWKHPTNFQVECKST